jgi:hypothetical protein
MKNPIRLWIIGEHAPLGYLPDNQLLFNYGYIESITGPGKSVIRNGSYGNLMFFET